MGTTKKPQWPVPSNALERIAFSIPEICFRNDISRTAYHRLRSEGRGPRETRFGLNLIRITLEDEREWLHRLQEESADFETQPSRWSQCASSRHRRSGASVRRSRRGAASAPRPGAPPRRAVRAGTAAAQSPTHVSKRRRRARTPP